MNINVQKHSAPRVKRALLVGMSYLSGSVNKVIPCYDHDVFNVKDRLEMSYGFHPLKIDIMFDSDVYFTEKPTAWNVYTRLMDLVLRSAYGDTLFFYFSGHGGRKKAFKESNNTSRYFEYIVLAENSILTDVMMRKITEQMCYGGCFVIVTDSCHSGGFLEGADEQIGTSVKITRSDLPLFKSPSKRDLGIHLSACQSWETTSFVKDQRSKDYGSVFTNMLLKVLDKKRGQLTYRELVAAINKKLAKRPKTQTAGLYCSVDQSNRLFLKE